ncbi:MAG: hypothetical protein WCV58_01350 [Patescibacteria group bacterium]
MNFLNERKSVLYLYLPFVVWIVLVVLIRNFVSPFQINLITLASIFIPGFALSRLIRIKFFNDTFGQVILWLSLGLIYNLFLCLIGLFINLRLSELTWFYLVISAILFLAAGIVDFKDNRIKKVFSWQVFKLENLIFLFLFLFLISVLCIVDQLGANFLGDPLYHLSAMRRAIENQPLSIENISHVKDQFHPTYIFSVWQIFLSLLAKISGANIFMFWQEAPIALTIIFFMVWYWLLLKIFSNKFLAVLGLFLVTNYYFWNNGYIFTRLPVPDTLSQLIIMPLSFSLALKYIFDKATNYKHLIILSLVVSLMTLVHQTQYLYYLFGMCSFGVLYAIFKFKEVGFRQIFKKIVLATFANLVIAIPIFLIIQAKGNTLTKHLDVFTTMKPTLRNDRFDEFDQYLKYAYIFLPLVLIFIRKYRKLIFLLGVFVLGPVIHNIPGLTDWFIDHLSHVFIKRFYSNLGWAPIIWTLFSGFAILLIDRFLNKVISGRNNIRYLIDSTLSVSAIIIFYCQFKFEAVANFYDKVFSSSTNQWLNNNYLWLVALMLVASVSIFIFENRHSKLREFFEFSEPRNQVPVLILSLILIFFLSSPAQGHLRTFTKAEITNWHFFAKENDPTDLIINTDKFGGMETIEFIKNYIPAKAVFDSSDANYVLPTMVDVHMASYTFDPKPTKKYAEIHYFDTPNKKRLELIKDGQIEYILYLYGDEKVSPFDQYPEYFTKTYNNKAAIYKVNQTMIQSGI